MTPFLRFSWRRNTLYHLFRSRFGYRDWSNPRGGFALMRFLYAHEWLSAERPGVLFDLAITWLVDHKVVLPGICSSF